MNRKENKGINKKMEKQRNEKGEIEEKTKEWNGKEGMEIVRE